MAPDILWQGMLIYIQEVFWIGDQGERAHPYAVHYTSHILELPLAFHYDWENETILPGALRHFKWYQTCTVTFCAYITLYGFSVNSRWWGEGGMVTAPGPSCGPSAQGVNPPVCCVLDAVVIYARDSSCWFWHQAYSSSIGGGGPDILAPGLQCLSGLKFQKTLFSTYCKLLLLL